MNSTNKVNILIISSLVASMFGYSFQGSADRFLLLIYALIILISTTIAFILIIRSKPPKKIYIETLSFFIVYHFISILVSTRLGGVINIITSLILMFIYTKTIYNDILKLSL
jgi:hypothetical protein